MEAAFFDLDKTVIAKASMVAFGGPFYRHGLISRRLLVRGLWGQLVYLYLGADEERLARMRESVLALTKGWQQAQVRRIVREALTDVVTPIIYAEALELIVSASPEEIVEPLAQHLDVDEAIASRARLDAEGCYTGEMEFYAYGANKAEAMRAVAEKEGIDLSESWAYSDSATDIPMLETVGHPVAVNPDRELARVARDLGWEVRKFERPVRLRDRVPTPPPAPTAVGASALVAGGLAALWWRRRHAPAPPSRMSDLRRLAASLPPRLRGR